MSIGQITVLEDGRFSATGLPSGAINFYSGTTNTQGHPNLRNIQYENRLNRAAEIYNGFLSIDDGEFISKAGLLIARLKELGFANLLKRGAYPTAIPTIDGRHNYTTHLFRTFLPLLNDMIWRHREGLWTCDFPEAISRSTTEQFSCDHRHGALFEKTHHGTIYGLHLPFALQGFSLHGARELIKYLPPNFSLCGPIETCAAMLLYHDFLIIDPARPVMLSAGIHWNEDPELTVAIGTATHQQPDGDNQIELHCGFSPPYLYSNGSNKFSPGLFFQL